MKISEVRKNLSKLDKWKNRLSYMGGSAAIMLIIAQHLKFHWLICHILLGISGFCLGLVAAYWLIRLACWLASSRH